MVIAEALLHGNAVFFRLVEGRAQDLFLLPAERPVFQVDTGFAAKLGAKQAKAAVEVVHDRFGYLDVAGGREALVKLFQDQLKVFRCGDRIGEHERAAPFAHIRQVANAGHIEILHLRLQRRERLGMGAVLLEVTDALRKGKYTFVQRAYAIE